MRRGSCHRTARCGARLLYPDSNSGPRGDCRGDFFRPLARLSNHPRRTLPILHCRPGMNRNSPYPPRHAFLSRASTPLAGRASFAPCDRRRRCHARLGWVSRGLSQRSRQDVQPLAQHVGPSMEGPLLKVACPDALRALSRENHPAKKVLTIAQSIAYGSILMQSTIYAGRKSAAVRCG